MKLLDDPVGILAAQSAACHELHRRLGRFFKRNIVIAFDEWRTTNVFNLETMVNGLNEAHTPELIEYYNLIQEQQCSNGEKGDPGDPGPPGSEYIVDGSSEDQSDNTGDWQQKLRVSFAATAGYRYKIEWYYELGKGADEDAEGRTQINDLTEIEFSHFKNQPFSFRWNEGCAGYYITTDLDGPVNVDIDFKNGYGETAATIRRARLLVTRLL